MLAEQRADGRMGRTLWDWPGRHLADVKPAWALLNLWSPAGEPLEFTVEQKSQLAEMLRH